MERAVSIKPTSIRTTTVASASLKRTLSFSYPLLTYRDKLTSDEDNDSVISSLTSLTSKSRQLPPSPSREPPRAKRFREAFLQAPQVRTCHLPLWIGGQASLPFHFPNRQLQPTLPSPPTVSDRPSAHELPMSLEQEDEPETILWNPRKQNNKTNKIPSYLINPTYPNPAEMHPDSLKTIITRSTVPNSRLTPSLPQAIIHHGGELNLEL